MRKLVLLAAACSHDPSPSPSPSPSPIRDARAAAVADARPAAQDDVWTHAMHHHELDRAQLAKQLAGKMKDVTLVAFWASWCKPCTKELPQLDKLVAAEHDPRVAIIAVNLDHERGDAERFLAANHLTLPVVFDPDAEIYQTVFLGSTDMILPSTAIVWGAGIEIDDGYQVATDADYIAKMQGKLAAHLGR